VESRDAGARKTGLKRPGAAGRTVQRSKPSIYSKVSEIRLEGGGGKGQRAGTQRVCG
jgi:hypothetical protein